MKRVINTSAFSKVTILITWLIYCLVSHRFFYTTSGGWHYILNQYIYGAFFAVATVALLFILIKSSASKLRIDIPFLLFVLGIQLILIAFNFGDCQDAGGSYFYIERFYKNISDRCANDYSHKLTLTWLLMLSYFTTVLFGFFKLYSDNRNSRKQS